MGKNRKIEKIMPLIVVAMPMAMKACRDMMEGVFEYEKLYGPWRLDIIEERFGEQKYDRVKSAKITGIIALLHNPENEQFIEKCKVPTVLLDPLDLNPPFLNQIPSGYVVNDTVTVGRIAAEHFLQKKFKNFAYLGTTEDINWSIHRGEGFAQRLNEAGFSCHIYPDSKGTKPVSREQELKILRRWIKNLPKPVGILAAWDVRGRQALDACLLEGISVPHEVSVLAVDNDKTLCSSTYPPMSSIQMETRHAGFLAAKMLDAIIHEKPSERLLVHYGAGVVVPRASTNCLHVTDKCVMDALEYISVAAEKGINVNDVVKYLNVSRRKLEMRFQENLHCSVLSEIFRVQIQRIKMLLCETDLSHYEIASLCGFQTESYLGKFFKRQVNLTMTDYRKKYKIKNE